MSQVASQAKLLKYGASQNKKNLGKSLAVSMHVLEHLFIDMPNPLSPFAESGPTHSVSLVCYDL